jgi:hypothetical protein
MGQLGLLRWRLCLASGFRLLPSHFQLLASGFWHPAQHGFHLGTRMSGTLAPTLCWGFPFIL